MLFSSLTFLFIFFPVVLILYFCPVFKSLKLKNIILLITSILFYAYGEPKFVIVMMTSIVINYLCAIVVDRSIKYRKPALVIAMVINIAILFIFKYLNFAVSNIDKIFGDILPQTDIILPIGISFFTFQAVSYVIDVYRHDAKVQKNILYVALYISFFPQLIAGPIVRYTDIESRLYARETRMSDLAEGAKLFIAGLAKKVIIANNLAIIADAAYNSTQTGEVTSIVLAWTGAVAYALQIYFDFDGYSEMARGLGKMFGFEFPRNFIYPYRARTINEFWKFNHISLCTWFRDYVYIPLGGSREGKGKWLRNMMIVWALTGIWHGASWVFLFWGLCYGVIIILEKEVNIERLTHNKAAETVYRIATLMMLFVLNGVFFRNLPSDYTKNYVCSMFGGADMFIDSIAVQYLCEYKVIIVFAIIYAMAGFLKLRDKIRDTKLNGAVELITPVVYTMLFWIAVSYLVIGAYNPFIYFNF